MDEALAVFIWYFMGLVAGAIIAMIVSKITQ